MPRDARGAEWGRYRKAAMNRRRTAQERRRLKIAAVYLLRRFDSELTWFGAPQSVAKVGRSARSPFQRVIELAAHRYEVFAYWIVAHGDLQPAERAALHAMRSAFVTLRGGREAFYVGTMEHAHAVVEASIALYAIKRVRVDPHGESICLSESGRATDREVIRGLPLGGPGRATLDYRTEVARFGDGAGQHNAEQNARPRRRKSRGRCLCEECRRTDDQKSLI